jgi:hypothetical protein
MIVWYTSSIGYDTYSIAKAERCRAASGTVRRAALENKKEHGTVRTYQYVTLRYVTLPYLTLPYLTLRYVTLRTARSNGNQTLESNSGFVR